MSFKDLWQIIKKPRKVTPTQTLSHDDIEEKKRLAHEERKLDLELQKLQVDKLKRAERMKTYEELKADILEDADLDEDDEEGDELDAIGDLFGSIINRIPNNQAPPQMPPTRAATNEARSSMSDDDIRAFLVKQKRSHLKLAKTMPKEALKRRAMAEMHLNEVEAERAHQILMEEF